MDITRRLQEHIDDAAELAKQQSDHASLATRINDYLADKLTALQMKELSDAYGPQIDAEIERRGQAARRKKELDEKNALRIFNGVFTEKEEAAARKACFEFGQKYPSFLGIVKNQLTLLEEVANRKQFVTVESLESAYKFLRSQGAFVEPIEPIQSADDFLKDHTELHDTRTPPIARAAVEKALVSFASLNPEYLPTAKNGSLMMQWLAETELPPATGNLNQAFHALRSQGLLELNSAIMQSGSTRFTDYGNTAQHGIPPRPEKASFRKKVEGMTSTEIAEACRLDPAFERALNSL
jgi:hypothetical protein